MSALASRFGATGDAKVYAGEVLSAELAFTNGTNTTVDLIGRQFVMVIWVAKTRAEVVSVTGDIRSDGTGKYVYFELDGDATESIYQSYGSLGLRVALAEVISGGLDYKIEGALRISSSPSGVTPELSQSVAGPPISRFTYDYASRRTILDGRGSPGLSPWQLDGQSYAEWLGEKVIDPVAGATAEVDAAILEMGEAFTTQQAQVDAAVGTAIAATEAARTGAVTAATNANNKAAAAQGVVDAGATILAAVPTAQTARDQAVAAAASVTQSRDVLDAYSPLTVTQTATFGVSTPATGPAFLNSSLGYVGTASRSGVLQSLSTFIVTLNSGAAYVVITSGTLASPVVKSVTALPAATATGLKTWTMNDLAGLRLEASDSVWIYSPPTTGFAGVQLAASGQTIYYKYPLPTTPTVGATITTATTPGYQVQANFTISYKAPAVNDGALDTSTRTLLGYIKTAALSEAGYVGTPVPGTSNFVNNSLGIVGITANSGTLTSVKTYITQVNGGAAQLVIMSGTPGSPKVKSKVTLPTVSSVGVKEWTAADFGAISMAAGDMVFIYSPATTGIAQGTKTVAGNTHYFKYPFAEPLNVGDTITSMSTTSNWQMTANFVIDRGGIQTLSEAERAKIAALQAEVAPTEYVMFLVGPAQSNGVGYGEAGAPAIASGIAYQYYGSALTSLTGDPVGNAPIGSMWPSFINEFYRRTGLGVIIVPCGYGGSAMLSAATTTGTTNWSSTGTLRGAAVTAVQEAMAAATAANLAWRFGGCLMAQGETDADGIDSAKAGVSAENYKTEFAAWLSYTSTALGIASTVMPVIISRIGTKNAGDTTGYAQIRNAQVELVRANRNVMMGYTGAANFVARSLMRDTFHYRQAAYNEIGVAMGRVAASACVGRA